ncbi:MAG: hypothetical protein M5U28_03655 [Sandaracinaceae bacterium]|nr:hypothetical protein [Sandaracinaceae bacterium]
MGSCRMPKHLEACELARAARGLDLRRVEVGRHRDDGAIHPHVAARLLDQILAQCGRAAPRGSSRSPPRA